jgi:WD40 repeat protein
MFTSSLDKSIRVWTISTGTVIKTIKSPAIFDEPVLCMSLHSNAIAIGGSGGSIQVRSTLHLTPPRFSFVLQALFCIFCDV